MVYILLGTGFEEMEALVTADVLRRGNIPVSLVGIGNLTVTGGHGITVVCDLTADRVGLGDGDMVVLPGGMDGVASIEGSETAMELVYQAAADENLYLAAICAAPTLLARVGIIGKGQQAVCYPGMEYMLTEAGAEAPMEQSAVVCGRLITSQAPGTAYDFALTLLALLAGQDAADSIRADLHYRG